MEGIMGREKSTTNTIVQSQAKAEPTPEETRLNQLEIARIEATQPGQIQTQQAGLDLINRLLAGDTNMPGFFGDIGRGISPEIISEVVGESMKDIGAQFQGLGILDSGTSRSIMGRTAGDIRRGSAEYNLGNKINLLNLALSGQGQIQQPLLAQSEMLGSRLAGLRTINQSSNTNTQTRGMNPFLRSFQSSLGESLGSPSYSQAAGFGFGG